MPLGFLQGNGKHIIKKTQTYLGVCYVTSTGDIIVHKINIVLALTESTGEEYK